MMALWNVKNLDPPPINSCRSSAKEVDVRLLGITIKDGIEFFENQQHLFTEATLLSRTVYRLKMKFRSSKDFKAVEKLNRVLRTYLHVQISKALKTLSNSIPQNYKANQSNMFTKNMMDFVLVRIQGLGKLLCRILETCKIVSGLTQQRLRLGHFWKIAMIIFAVTARIFVIARTILKYTCELYQSLLAFSSNLNNSGVRWLPKLYVFPSRLDDWLGVDWLDLENTVIEIPDEEPGMSYLNLLEDSDEDVEFCDEYVLVKDDSLLEETEQLSESVELCEDTEEHSNDQVDVGEVINLSEIETPPMLKRKRRPDNIGNFIKRRNLGVTKKKDKKVNESLISISDSSDVEVVNVQSTKSGAKKTKKRRKKKNNKKSLLQKKQK
jgi:hypothetical protein